MRVIFENGAIDFEHGEQLISGIFVVDKAVWILKSYMLIDSLGQLLLNWFAVLVVL